jgi:Stage II sporulation protein E (SpoIIE)
VRPSRGSPTPRQRVVEYRTRERLRRAIVGGLASGRLRYLAAGPSVPAADALFTDGITEARDEAGNFFGEDRLVDFLRREAAASHPAPETVRRLVHAVMRHQRGVLQDDATVLLARWDAQLGARTERSSAGVHGNRRVGYRHTATDDAADRVGSGIDPGMP